MLNFGQTLAMASQIKWVYLAVLALIWGSSFILIKLGLTNLTPFQLGAFRILCAGIFLLSIGFRRLPTIPGYKWKMIALTALCGSFAPAFLFAIAQTQISSTVSSILNSLTPVAVLVLGMTLFGLTFRRAQIWGVVLGLAGAVLLILSGAADHPDQNYWYALLALAGSVFYGINVNLLKKYLSDLPPLTIATGNFAIMFLPALIVLLFSGFFSLEFHAERLHSVGYVMFLGIMGTGLANLVFYRLIQAASPVFASSVTYLMPVVAFFWGMFDNEMLSPLQFLGAAIILFGVYLSGKKSE